MDYEKPNGSGLGKEITVFELKQSEPRNSKDWNQVYLGYKEIDVNYIRDKKTQREIVEKIRRSIPIIPDMANYAKDYKSFIVIFDGGSKPIYPLIKHRDFGRLSK